MRFSNLSLGAKLTCVSAFAIAFCLIVGIFLQTVQTSKTTEELTVGEARSVADRSCANAEFRVRSNRAKHETVRNT